MAKFAVMDDAADSIAQHIGQLPIINTTDFYALSIFLIITVVSFIGRWEGNFSFYSTESDASNIASFVAADENPQLFERDFILDNPNNFRVYFTAHFPVLSFMADLGATYSGAFLILFPIHVFLHLIGYYILGRVLFQKRRYAFLLAIFTGLYVPINLGEYWGLGFDAIPRFSFQTLLAYILAGAIVWRNRPRRWFLVMFAVGLLVYVHPVSTPAWGLALWLGFWYFLPRSFSLLQKFVLMGALGLVFVLTILPFAVHYLSEFEHGVTTDHTQVMRILKDSYGEGFFNLSVALTDFLATQHMGFMILLAGCGLFTTWFIQRIKNRDLLILLCLWLIALLFVAMGLTLVDHMIANQRGEFPFQVDLIRGLRYVILFLWIFIIWLFVSLEEYLSTKLAGRVLRVFQATFVVLVIILYAPDRPTANGFGCLLRGRLECSTQEQIDFVQLLEYVKKVTSPDSLLITTDTGNTANSIDIRHNALRPLAYASKDGGILGYANHERLMDWYTMTEEVDRITKIEDVDERIRDWIDFAVGLDSNYLVIHGRREETISAIQSTIFEPVFVSENYVLLKLTQQS